MQSERATLTIIRNLIGIEVSQVCGKCQCQYWLTFFASPSTTKEELLFETTPPLNIGTRWPNPLSREEKRCDPTLLHRNILSKYITFSPSLPLLCFCWWAEVRFKQYCLDLFRCIAYQPQETSYFPVVDDYPMEFIRS